MIWKQSSTTNKIFLAILLIVFLAAFMLLILNFTGNLPWGSGAKANELTIPTPEADQPALTANSEVEVRAGPGIDYVQYGVLEAEKSAAVTGVSPDNGWWAILIPELELGQGWVSNEAVTTSNVEDVSIIEPPPVLTILTIPTPQADAPALTALSIIHVWEGPGSPYEPFGMLSMNQEAEITSASEDGEYWVIKVDENGDLQGWVASEYVTTRNADTVAVVAAPELAEIQIDSETGLAAVTASQDTDIYSEPNSQAYVYGILAQGEQARVIGRNEAGDWWLIQTPDLENEEGWVLAESVLPVNTEMVAVVTPVATSQPPETIKATNATVTAGTNVNIRSGPGTTFALSGLLENGQSAPALGISEDRAWWYIQLPGEDDERGWVSAQYVTANDAELLPTVSESGELVREAASVPAPEESAPSLTATVNVNIRSGPGTQFEVVGMLTFDQSAEVVGISEDGSWWAILHTGGENSRGWISADYVTVKNAENVPVLK